jgi:hypothetical protein
VPKRRLIERAAEVLGVRADVIGRAASLQKKGQSLEHPVRAALRERHLSEETLERGLLSSLLLAPGALDEARARLSPEDFRDDACRALALWIWAGNAGLPEQEPAASLGRELALAPSAHLDWMAEAHGGIRRMVERRLKQQLRDCRNRLSQVSGADDASRLMQEIDEIARSLRDLNA